MLENIFFNIHLITTLYCIFENVPLSVSFDCNNRFSFGFNIINNLSLMFNCNNIVVGRDVSILHENLKTRVRTFSSLTHGIYLNASLSTNAQ